jgi:hypothetical protein
VARRNRVTPLSDLIATPERGLVYGNRGCLHDRHGEIRRRYATRRWIACRLQFRGRRRTRLMAPGRYTELFFLDDATALAADLWSKLHPGQRGADAIDAQLHDERLDARTGGRRFHAIPYAGLPDGVFVLHDGCPHVALGSALLAWSPGGYVARRARPRRGQAVVITPPSLLELLRVGWEPLVPLLHPSTG